MGTKLPGGRPARRAPIRWIWMSIGWFFIALGSIGIIVPGLPTTVFFIVAASCFARVSPRFETWVLNLPKVGPLVRDYRAGRGMPRQAKIVAIGMMLVSVTVSAGFLMTSSVWRIVLAVMGMVGTWYIGWRIPTRERMIGGSSAPPSRTYPSAGPLPKRAPHDPPPPL
jgi:uncharacterized protein